jgi:hypothetical protein
MCSPVTGIQVLEFFRYGYYKKHNIRIQDMDYKFALTEMWKRYQNLFKVRNAKTPTNSVKNNLF